MLHQDLQESLAVFLQEKGFTVLTLRKSLKNEPKPKHGASRSQFIELSQLDLRCLEHPVDVYVLKDAGMVLVC